MKRLTHALSLTVLAATLPLLAQQPMPQQPTPEQMQQMMQAFGQAMATASAGATNVTLVEHRELKALLPAAIQGMKRTGAESEKTSAMGMTVSRAEAKYEAADGTTAEIEITDMAGVGGFAAMAGMGWASMDMDKETDEGYERTFTHKGFKGMESYDNGAKSGSIEMMIDGRFTVRISTDGLAADRLRVILDQVDLAKLKTLAGAGQ